MARAKNIRHDLDPEKVKASVAAQVADWERWRVSQKQEEAQLREQYDADLAQGKSVDWMRCRWQRIPDDGAQVDARVDKSIAKEREFYGKVRVIEVCKPAKRFLLVYGDVSDEEVTSGTGPFGSVEQAATFFFNGGR